MTDAHSPKTKKFAKIIFHKNKFNLIKREINLKTQTNNYVLYRMTEFKCACQPFLLTHFAFCSPHLSVKRWRIARATISLSFLFDSSTNHDIVCCLTYARLQQFITQFIFISCGQKISLMERKNSKN